MRAARQRPILLASLLVGLGAWCAATAAHAQKRAIRYKQTVASEAEVVEGVRFPKGTRFSWASIAEPEAWWLVEAKLGSELSVAGVRLAAGSRLALGCNPAGCYDTVAPSSCFSGELARDQTLAGIPLRARTSAVFLCTGATCVDRADSVAAVLEGTLGASREIQGRAYPAGTEFSRSLDEAGTCHYALTVPKPLVIEGLLVQGALDFYADGSLQFAHLAEDFESQGIRCLGQRVEGVYLHPNGSLEYCNAARGLIGGCHWRGRVSFYDTGRPELIGLDQSCVLDGAALARGTELHFDPSGSMSVQAP